MAQDRHAAFTSGFQFLDFGGKFLRELLIEALGQNEIFVRDPVGRQEEVVRHLADREVRLFLALGRVRIERTRGTQVQRRQVDGRYCAAGGKWRLRQHVRKLGRASWRERVGTYVEI